MFGEGKNRSNAKAKRGRTGGRQGVAAVGETRDMCGWEMQCILGVETIRLPLKQAQWGGPEAAEGKG